MESVGGKVIQHQNSANPFQSDYLKSTKSEAYPDYFGGSATTLQQNRTVKTSYTDVYVQIDEEGHIIGPCRDGFCLPYDRAMNMSKSDRKRLYKKW